MIISRSFLLAVKNVSGISCGENQNTHFMCSNFKKKNTVYGMWKNDIEPYTPRDNMAHAHCILVI
jgi:hypothetical protein